MQWPAPFGPVAMFGSPHSAEQLRHRDNRCQRPQRPQCFMAASLDPDLGITPRPDVLGERVVEAA